MFTTNINLFYKYFTNLILLDKIFYILLFLIIITLIYNFFNIKTRENFTSNSNNYKLLIDDEKYDDFYSDLYDVISYNKENNIDLITNIIKLTNINNNSSILDIGSKNGHIINQLNKLTNHICGLEESKSFINKAKKIYPKINIINKNILINNIFNSSTFTHILALNNILYRYNNQKQFLENIYYWLKPNGFFILELSNKLSPLDNIINARKNNFPKNIDPTLLLSNNIKFKDFYYEPIYHKYNDNIVIYDEIIKFNDKSIRKHEEKLYINNISYIQKVAKYIGYKFIKSFKSLDSKQSIYIFQKSN